jgi:hypothetical protein
LTIYRSINGFVESMELRALFVGGAVSRGASDRHEELLPRRGAAPEREDVVDPQSVSSVPAFLAFLENSHGHVPGTVPQGPVPPQEGGDRDGAEPQRDPEDGEDGPDHVTLAFFGIMVSSCVSHRTTVNRGA